MPPSPQDQSPSPLARRARTVFRICFVAWVVLWAASFGVDALTAPSHAVAGLALLCGLVWLLAERRPSKDS